MPIERVGLNCQAAWYVLSALLDNTLTRYLQAIFNFTKHAFEGTPRGKVFLAIAPEYTVGDLIKVRDTSTDSELSERNCWVRGTCGELGIEAANLTFIETIYTDCGQNEASAQVYSRIYDDELVKSICSLPTLERKALDKVHQAKESSEYLPWRMSSFGAINAMSELREFQFSTPLVTFSLITGSVKSIFARRNTIEVLQFQKVPVLDRRLLAIILRGCPRVRMIGIYDCPLIHFGDVTCLLDLISEVNTSRRADGLPEIEAFDFSPNFNYGMPWNHPSARTYGLTWKPYPDEVVRRGFFRILLEAHLKACRMGLKLLFDETHAFRTFLNRIPAFGGSVPHFLDAVYRHMDATKARKPNTDAQDRAFDDLLTHVDTGLESQSGVFSPSLPKRTRDRFRKSLYFCCSCGYEMGEQFFLTTVRPNPPHRRTCAGCNLRRILDTEEDHGKLARRTLLRTMFPDWEGTEFNKDAPMHQHGRSLMNLVSDEAVRPAEPGLQIDANGHIFQPNFEIALVRDRKAHFDSLQDLPDLEQMAVRSKSVMRWMQIETEAKADDALRATRMLLHNAKPKGDTEAFYLTSSEQGYAHHFYEPQPAPPPSRRREFW